MSERIRSEQIRHTPSENKRLSQGLFVAFRRAVGEETGLPHLVDTPDFTTPNGEINPAYVSFMRERNERISSTSPGRLVYRRNSGWSAIDENSPTDRIQTLQNSSRALPENTNRTNSSPHAKPVRRELANIMNDFAGVRFNNVRDVSSGKDYAGLGLSYLENRSLKDWREELIRTRQQAIDPVLFERWEDAPSKDKIATPSRADKFCASLFAELKSAGISDSSLDPRSSADLSDAAQLFHGLLQLPGAKGYVELSNLFYMGNMEKASFNLTFLAKHYGVKLPKHWVRFQGTTEEFRETEKNWESFEEGIEGYKQAANEKYAGDMTKAYKRVSAVSTLTGKTMPEGWQSFQGTTKEFDLLTERLQSLIGGIEGYLEAADQLYDGDMMKTYQSLSAVAKMTGRKLPEGWQSFQGTTSEFHALSSQINDLQSGIEGYREASIRLFGGNMRKAHQSISAVVNMTGRELPSGWSQFQGTTNEFAVQSEWVAANPGASYSMFEKKFGCTTNTAKINLAAIRNMMPVRAAA